MTNEHLIDAMANSFYELMKCASLFCNDVSDCIEYAKKRSCAGNAAQRIAINRFLETVKA